MASYFLRYQKESFFIMDNIIRFIVTYIIFLGAQVIIYEIFDLHTTFIRFMLICLSFHIVGFLLSFIKIEVKNER